MISYIHGKEFAQIIGCSINTLIMLKKEQGMKQGSRLTDEDIPKFKKLSEEWLKSKSARRSGKGVDHYNHYIEARALIKKQGYASSSELTDIFGISTILNVQTYFEGMEDPLYYDDEIVVRYDKRKRGTEKRYTKMKVYKLFLDLKKEYREENELYGRLAKNGAIATNERRMF